MKRIGFLLGLLLFLGARPALAVGSFANVTVHDRSSGETLPVFEADGRWYVAGRVGSEYEVRIRNDTIGDLLAVVSETSYPRYVSFERESDSPNELVVVRYDTRAHLVARGVICCPPPDPNPVPTHFVPDPPLR